MSTTPTTCPHCGAGEIVRPKPMNRFTRRFECGTVSNLDATEGTRGAACYSRQIAALKAELEQAMADRDRAAMEERNKCLATMERQKGALEKARDRIEYHARQGHMYASDAEALAAITAALEAQP